MMSIELKEYVSGLIMITLKATIFWIIFSYLAENRKKSRNII